MFIKMPSPFMVAKILVLWLWSLIGAFASNRRYVMLTPPFFRRQFLWSKNERGGAFTIRDVVDWYTAYEIFLLEDYSIRGLKRCVEIQSFYTRLLAAGKRPFIIDCGGNIGLASRFFCLEFPNSKIISLEPNLENIDLAKNNIGNEVEIIPAAIGPNDGRGSIVDPGLGANAYRIIDASDGSTKMCSINSILTDLMSESDVPFLVKIDIEGYESELFSKNVEWIDRFPVLMIELHDWMLPRQATSRNFLLEISKRNRDFVQVGGNIFSISNDLFLHQYNSNI